MLSYQDFLKVKETNDINRICDFITTAINQHISSPMYKVAEDATLYDKQQNSTIMNYTRYIYNSVGIKNIDPISSNNKMCSNIYHRLNTQRCLYSLGNGVSFTNDKVKALLGKNFDNALKDGAYKSLIQGLSFGFWDFDKLTVFSFLEFVPLWDEETSDLRGGIRFWRIDDKKPLFVRLFEEDGVTKFIQENGEKMKIQEPKKGFIKIVKSTDETGIEGIEFKNYKNFPIIPLWANSLHQSTLVGTKGLIDAYDLVRSGYANDLEDCAEIYWIVNNASGMDSTDLARFRSKLKLNHVATVDDENSSVVPYTQDIPTTARIQFLDLIKQSIYEDFGGLDVHTIQASSTNDHIEAAYQPLDEEADDFELQIIKFIHNLLALLDIEDDPIFKRNRISNQKEQTEMILSAAEYLDDETVLTKLPFISVDEVTEILKKKDKQDELKFNSETDTNDLNINKPEIDDQNAAEEEGKING